MQTQPTIRKLLLGKKPKALFGNAGKKERQRFKSLKGTIFPRTKQKPPTLMEMYRKIMTIEKSQRTKIEKGRATNEYLLRRLFSPKARQSLAFIGYSTATLHYADKYHRELDSLARRIGKCNKEGLRKVKEALDFVNKEFKAAMAYMDENVITPAAIRKNREIVGIVGHKLKGTFNSILGQTGYVASHLKQREKYES